MTLKFDGWPRKIIGHLFYATSSFVQHFVAIGAFKLELQSGNAQSGSNSTIFSPVTKKFYGWPSKTIGHLFYAISSFVHHFVAISEFKLELQSGNAQFGSNSRIFRAVRPRNLTDKPIINSSLPKVVVMMHISESTLSYTWHKHFSSYCDVFSCDQAALWTVFSVRLSVCLSVCHTFLTMFPPSYHHEIFRSYYQWPKWRSCKRSRSEVKGQGHSGHNPT